MSKTFLSDKPVEFLYQRSRVFGKTHILVRIRALRLVEKHAFCQLFTGTSIVRSRSKQLQVHRLHQVGVLERRLIRLRQHFAQLIA